MSGGAQDRARHGVKTAVQEAVSALKAYQSRPPRFYIVVDGMKGPHTHVASGAGEGHRGPASLRGWSKLRRAAGARQGVKSAAGAEEASGVVAIESLWRFMHWRRRLEEWPSFA